MREIKFRAWDKEKNSMKYDVQDISEMNPISDFDSFERILNAPTEDEYGLIIDGTKRFEVMQYTGLKDKNGKEIYEGDICKTKFFGKENGNGQNSADYDIFKIVYKHGSYLLESNSRQFSASYIEDMAGSGGIEVIGNIYDNPELLGSDTE